MPAQHFPGNLRVAWLVRADQSEVCKSEEKEEAAKSGEQENIGREARRGLVFHGGARAHSGFQLRPMA